MSTAYLHVLLILLVTDVFSKHIKYLLGTVFRAGQHTNANDMKRSESQALEILVQKELGSRGYLK